MYFIWTTINVKNALAMDPELCMVTKTKFIEKRKECPTYQPHIIHHASEGTSITVGVSDNVRHDFYMCLLGKG